MGHGQFAEHFFKLLVMHFIGRPADLKVRASNGEGFISITPSCNPLDFGRIVGSGGDNYTRLKILMQLAGEKRGQIYKLERIQSIGGEREKNTPPKLKTNWSAADTKAVKEILEGILSGILVHDYSITPEGNADHTNFRVKLDDSEPLSIDQKEFVEIVSRIIGAIGYVRGRKMKMYL